MTRTHAKRRRKRSPRRVVRLAVTICVITITAVGVAYIAQSDNRESTSATDTKEATPAPRAKVPPTPTPSASAVAATTQSPSSAEVPTVARGTFSVAPGISTQGAGGQTITYQVEVEDGLPFLAEDFANRVDRTLTDRRGWSASGDYTFNRRPSAARRIVLASPKTVDRLCAPLQTRGKVSCRNGDVVAINAVRWAEGAKSYGNDLSGYRTYVINHEVGHSLGLAHQPCAAHGSPAPVMLQQTLGLEGCRKNPWP